MPVYAPHRSLSQAGVLASIGGPGSSSIFFVVDLFVPKIKLRERERERVNVLAT